MRLPSGILIEPFGGTLGVGADWVGSQMVIGILITAGELGA